MIRIPRMGRMVGISRRPRKRPSFVIDLTEREPLERRCLPSVDVSMIPIPPGGKIFALGPITSGSDGNLWTSSYAANEIIEYSPASQSFSTYPITSTTLTPIQGITTGADGNVYFTESNANAIGVLNVTTHALSEIPVGPEVEGIATGPDGAIWFGTSDGTGTYPNSMLGRLDSTTHLVTDYSPGVEFTGSSADNPIVAGPDGSLWYFGFNTTTLGLELCSFNTTTYQVHAYPLAGQAFLGNITTTPDGRVWFAQMGPSAGADAVGVWSPATKTISYITLPTANAMTMAIAVGPDGDVWFGDRNQDIVGQINPTTYAITEYPFNGGDGRESGYMTVGADGNIYFSTPGADDLGKITIPPAPAAPQLDASSDTGISATDGITRNDGSAAAPLVFDLPASANGSFVRLYDVTNPLAPVLLAGPVQDTNGQISVSDQNDPEGVYRFAYILSDAADGSQSATSAPVTVTIEKTLTVQSVTPSTSFVTSLLNGQVSVTFNHPLAGLTADDPTGGGFKNAPFAVMLIPSGPDGAITQAQTGTFWSAPSGMDSGDLPVPATAVYHVNADGTSTITLAPDQPLATDIYLISVNGLVDPAGNPLETANGAPGTFYASFDDRPATSSAAPQVVSVTANQGAIVIDNTRIPQPDTIGIRFSKPMDAYTINTHTVQLFARGASGPLEAAVAYSPSTDTAYLTPEVMLTPGTIYYVAVSSSVTDTQSFPSPGTPLSTAFYTSFTVGSAGVQASGATSPLAVVRTEPLNGTQWTSPLGYGAVTFSKAGDPSSLGRFSVMLVPQTGGVTTGTSGYADVPVNAHVAFNPNTNQMVIVPTGILKDGTVYLFALSNMKATDGSALPGTVYSTFKLNAGVHTEVATRAALTPTDGPVPSGPSVGPNTNGASLPATGVEHRGRAGERSSRFERPRRPVTVRRAYERATSEALCLAASLGTDQ